MSIIIKEVWAPVEVDGKTEWRDCIVISLFKASMSRSIKDETISTEQMFAIAYYPLTGEIIELPLNELIIKVLCNTETNIIKNFNKPKEEKNENN